MFVSDLLKRELDSDREGEFCFFRTANGIEKYLRLMPNAIRPMVVYGGKTYPASQDAVSACNYLDMD